MNYIEVLNHFPLIMGTWVGVGSAAVGVAGTLLAPKKAAGTANYQPVNLQDAQSQAVQGNLANEGSIEALDAKSNAFQQTQANALMEQAMPGYTKLAGKLTGLASDLATNPYSLPADVQQNLQRQAAEQGISVGGGSGSQFSGFSLLRDLGVNELQYGQQRISQAQGLTGLLASIAPKVNPMSPMSFYATPGMAAGIAQSNNGIQQEIAQGGLNSQAAAQNNNNQSLWNSLAYGGGALASYFGGQPTTNNNQNNGSTLGPGTSIGTAGNLGVGAGGTPSNYGNSAFSGSPYAFGG